MVLRLLCSGGCFAAALVAAVQAFAGAPPAPADSTPSLLAAHEANPRDTAISIQLGLEFERARRFQTGRTTPRQAARYDHQYQPAWTLANYYFRQNEVDSFWTWAHRAAELSYDEGKPVLRLAVTLENEPVVLMDHLGCRPVLLRTYLDILIGQGRREAARQVAAMLAGSTISGSTPLRSTHTAIRGTKVTTITAVDSDSPQATRRLWWSACVHAAILILCLAIGAIPPIPASAIERERVTLIAPRPEIIPPLRLKKAEAKVTTAERKIETAVELRPPAPRQFIAPTRQLPIPPPTSRVEIASLQPIEVAPALNLAESLIRTRTATPSHRPRQTFEREKRCCRTATIHCQHNRRWLLEHKRQRFFAATYRDNANCRIFKLKHFRYLRRNRTNTSSRVWLSRRVSRQRAVPTCRPNKRPRYPTRRNYQEASTRLHRGSASHSPRRRGLA